MVGNMGQTEILSLLKKRCEWFEAKDIAQELGIRKNTINRSLNKLKEFNLIRTKEIYLYRHGLRPIYIYKQKTI